MEPHMCIFHAYFHTYPNQLKLCIIPNMSNRPHTYRWPCARCRNDAGSLVHDLSCASSHSHVGQ